MQLAKKKFLASKVLGVGKNRVIFDVGHLSEIKEAITRQDIVDLHKSGAIRIREIEGRKTIVRRKHRRSTGKIKGKVNNTKQEYVILIRKLRKFLKHLLKTSKITNQQYKEHRKMVKAKKFKSKRNLKEALNIKA